MEILQTIRIAVAFILCCLFLIVGGFNWLYVYIGLRLKFTKSTESVPSMIFVGWIFVILASIIYPSELAPAISPFWIFVIPIIDPSIGYMIIGLFILLPYHGIRQLFGKKSTFTHPFQK